MLLKLEGFQYYTSIDLNMGYYHIQLSAYTITRHLLSGVSDVDINWLDEKLNPWCISVKYWWIAFVVILKEKFINQGKFPFYQGGVILL